MTFSTNGKVAHVFFLSWRARVCRCWPVQMGNPNAVGGSKESVGGSKECSAWGMGEGCFLSVFIPQVWFPLYEETGAEWILVGICRPGK